jgi:periplasmic protein TonB
VQGISAKDIVMNQNTILQSNLLDIIFENRNREYGAYTLREAYNSRMRVALFLMAGISFFFCLIISRNSTSVLNLPVPVISTRDRTVSEFHPPSNPGHKVVLNTTHPKKMNTAEMPPRIVDSTNINKSAATPIGTMPSLVSTDVSEINFSSGEESLGDNSKTREGSNPELLMTNITKPAPINNPEIMPQYPGGIKALLEFLKKNLHAPEDINDGNEVLVKIKFVINYNGKLESFDVLKSGGIFFKGNFFILF